jgi:BASS family bile acid:Na+ symporter
MKMLASMLKNRNFILLLALVLGISVGTPVANWTSPLIIPFLIVVMTLSAMNITLREFTLGKNLFYAAGISLLLNYLVIGGFILLLAWWLVGEEDLWTGFVVLAAVPPAVGVVPFSFILGGNTLFSIIGLTATYLSALLIMPVILTSFLGTSFYNPMQVIVLMAELVLLPIVISRILLVLKLAGRIKPWQGIVTNWSFFIVIFTIIGLNREAFFSDFNVLIRLIAIGVFISLLLGIILDYVLRAFRVEREMRISMILMGTTKNYGLASGILLAIFDERAALPASVCAVFGVLNAVWLGLRFRTTRNIV